MRESNGDSHGGGFLIQAAGWVLEAGGDDEALFDGFARARCVAGIGCLERPGGGGDVEHQCGDGRSLVAALPSDGQCGSGQDRRASAPAVIRGTSGLAAGADISDFTLRGLVGELATRGVKVEYVQVWRFVHAEGLSFKKSVLPAEQLRPKVASRREQWKNYQGRLDPRRLVPSTSLWTGFVDETPAFAGAGSGPKPTWHNSEAGAAKVSGFMPRSPTAIGAR